MADHVIALAPLQFGPSPDNNGKIYEDVTVIGGAGGSTTGVWPSQFVKVPLYVIGGPGAFTISGRNVTLNGTLADGIEVAARIIGTA